MPFAYYRHLSPRQRRIYDRSDRIDSIPVPGAAALTSRVDDLARALQQEDRRRVQHCCQQLADGLAGQLQVPVVTIRVLATRPSDDWGELQGEYEPAQGRSGARITVWMRTARRRQVVAFRTFLRTLLHELCHHLDYVLLGLEDSFHTQGFYQRESALFRSLVRPSAAADNNGSGDENTGN